MAQEPRSEKVAAPETTQTEKLTQNVEGNIRKIFWTQGWQETGMAMASLAQLKVAFALSLHEALSG